MVRIALVLFFITTFIQASLLDKKIEHFIGQRQYKIQKNLIKILFKDKNEFLNTDKSVNDIKVLTKLKTSGLLKLFYNNPQKLNLSFFTKDNSLIFMRVINESLLSMGYNFFLTKRALKDENGFLWEIIISTEHIVDPTIFAKRLEVRGCYIKEIDKKSENEWIYEINTDNIKVDAKQVEPNTTVKLKKPIKPYWINVKEMKSISFRSRIADKWYPNIVFYDEKLHIVKDYRKDEITNTLKINIPRDAKYVKVADIYTLDNIKRGISIYLRSRN
ncbi:hypothetical protein [Sulfurospirillum arcachonense]|uniref:hypothetical protein n=1 Tax=Sulfurospirillum arcachonense TaxID=57666 RepID=UPI0004685D7D|nr:hypothetical protein [Sulfurospirillum arcachonense]